MHLAINSRLLQAIRASTNVCIDCREDTTPSRHIHCCLPRPPRDSKQGPPIRPRKGQRSETSTKTLWRIEGAQFCAEVGWDGHKVRRGPGVTVGTLEKD